MRDYCQYHRRPTSAPWLCILQWRCDFSLSGILYFRDRDMHEVSRRLLSVLLREIDGFDLSKRTVVIGATNRKQDLDPALISRWAKVPLKHAS